MNPEHLQSIKDFDRGIGIDPLPPDWYYYPLSELMDKDGVFGAEYRPGFSPIMSTWKLWADRSGWLSILLRDVNSYSKRPWQHQYAKVWIGKLETRLVTRYARKVGFAEMTSTFYNGMEDGSTYRIIVRLHGVLKEVEHYDVQPPGFRRLFRRIHRFAPLVGKYSPWWTRGWLGHLLDWRDG